MAKSDVIEVLESAIDSKLAYNKFLEIVKAQGGDVNVVKNNQIHIPSKSVSFVSQSEGYVGRINTLFLGELVRRLCYFTHDNNIGLKINVKIGDYIKKGDVILTMYNNDLRELDRYKSIIEGCVRITTEKYPATKVIKKVLR